MKIPALFLFGTVFFFLSVVCHGVEGQKKPQKKCKNPKGNHGSVRTEGCIKMTCMNGKWNTAINDAICCHDKTPYEPNTIISYLTANDGCTSTTITCEMEAKAAKIVYKLSTNCTKNAREDQVEELSAQIGYLTKLLVNHIADSDPTTTTNTTTTTTTTTTSTTTDPAPCTGGDSCCVDFAQCGLGEGDCDTDNHCTGNLKCGYNNCIGSTFDSTDDCCYNPDPAPCTGGDSCCVDFAQCGLGEGDCDTDNHCTGNLKCGYNNCIGSTFDSTDDCCYNPDPAPCTGGDSCCVDFAQCRLGEGDCDTDNHCTGNLKCGYNNCIGSTFDSTDDCCYDPDPAPCTGGDSCCLDFAQCGLGEGDCDTDNHCTGNLKCGYNNCKGSTFDSTDDCCYNPALKVMPMPSEEDLEEANETDHRMKEHEGEAVLNDSDEDATSEDATTDAFNNLLEKRTDAVKAN